MLTPNKHTSLRFSIFNVGAKIISILEDKKIAKYDEILDLLIRDIGEDVKIVFSATLSFLFILGKISYHEQIDALELNI